MGARWPTGQRDVAGLFRPQARAAAETVEVQSMSDDQQRPMTLGYSQELADEICDAVADGASLRSACEKLGLAHRTVRSWLERHPGFAEQYDRAKKLAVDDWVDQMREIAKSVEGSYSNAAVQAARLQIDTAKWVAAKLLPARFGDRIVTEVSGPSGKDLMPAVPDSQRLAMVLLAAITGAIKREEPPAAHRDGPSQTG
jgi:hypothetical protein